MLSLAVFCPLLASVVFSLASASTPSDIYHDYCIIGAGPGGLQMGHFLQKAGRDYIIFEKTNYTASFFLKYPRHRTLISINKRYTGKTNTEFNLRHDWNSLLSDDPSLLFRYYSQEMFPHADSIVKYFTDYKEKLGIQVQFNTDVSNIKQESEESFTMTDQNGNKYVCKTPILATGMGHVNIPKFKGVELTEGYEDVSIKPEDFEGQSVLILGRGNSAFETADRIYGHTNLIHMVGRSRVRLSWATHYVGDLRAVNNALLDTYQLKSLDGVLEAPIEDVQFYKKDGKIYLTLPFEEDDIDNFSLREPYDRVIRCLGFRFDHDIFAANMSSVSKKNKSKFPAIKWSYESADIPGLFYAGTNTHSLDFRKSAGGFLHGFRYTARATHRYLEWRNHNVAWPSVTQPITELLNFILKRINEASGPYQMFGVLGDVFALRSDGTEFEHFPEFPLNMLHKFPEMTGKSVGKIIVWVLEYGANFSGPGKDIFRLNRATGEPSNAHESNFLHPVFYYYESLPTVSEMNERSKKEILPVPDRIHHTLEDFLTTWDAPVSHILPLRRFLEYSIGKDIRKFYADTCFKYSMLYESNPIMCDKYVDGQGTYSTPELLTKMIQAGLKD